MLALNYTAPVATVKPAYTVAEDILIDLLPLADGTPVKGTISEGHPLGVDAEWRGIVISVGYDTVYGGESSLEVQFEDESLTVVDWSKRRKDMADLIEHNIIEQLIERARTWQPQLFD